MTKATLIQWTDNTWNLWQGCHKVSPSCRFCYMYRDKTRYGQDPTTVVRSANPTFYAPLKWKEPCLVFVCSWSDFFIKEADQWRDEAWEIIKTNTHITFQLLTKRPERITECLPADWGNGYPNVWLGVSCENEKYALSRLKILIETPAVVRWASFEPLLDDLVTENTVDLISKLDWAVIGGESGNETGNYRYRPCKTKWFDNIINVCREADVPVFMKQMGTYLKHEMGLNHTHGGDIDEWPEYLQIREFPHNYNKSHEL